VVDSGDIGIADIIMALGHCLGVHLHLPGRVLCT
jgi:hypothetical protein